MDRTDAEKLTELSRRLPEIDVAHNDVMLVGNALARQLAGLRANQAAMEAARTAFLQPRSAAAAARQAEAKAAQALVASIDGEMARLKVVPGVAQEGQVSVFGYVRQKGQPVAKARVELVGRAIAASTDSAADGSFALVAESVVALRLQVRRRDAVVFRDDEPVHTPARMPAYRLIDLDGTPRQEPSSPSRPSAASGPETKPAETPPRATRAATRAAASKPAARPRRKTAKADRPPAPSKPKPRST